MSQESNQIRKQYRFKQLISCMHIIVFLIILTPLNFVTLFDDPDSDTEKKSFLALIVEKINKIPDAEFDNSFNESEEKGVFYLLSNTDFCNSDSHITSCKISLHNSFYNNPSKDKATPPPRLLG